jgi:hypothetical protein
MRVCVRARLCCVYVHVHGEQCLASSPSRSLSALPWCTAYTPAFTYSTAFALTCSASLPCVERGTIAGTIELDDTNNLVSNAGCRRARGGRERREDGKVWMGRGWGWGWGEVGRGG